MDTSGVAAGVQALANSTKQPEVPDSLAAPFKGLGAVGAAIAQAGDVMSALAIQEEKDRVFNEKREAEERKATFLAEFDSYRATEANPSKWLPEYQSRFAAFKNQVLAGDLSPRAKAEITSDLDHWQAQVGFKVQTAATQMQSRKAADATRGGIANAIEGQRREEMESLIKEGVTNLRIEEFEAEHYRQRFEERGKQKAREDKALNYEAAENTIATLVAGGGLDNSIVEMDGGTFPVFEKLDPADKQRLRSYAQRVAQERSADALDTLATAVVEGEIGNPATLRARAEGNPHITPLVLDKAEQFLRQRDEIAERTEQDTNGVKNAVEMRIRAKDYDPAKDASGEQYYTLRQEMLATVPPGMRDSISDILDAKFAGRRVPVRPEMRSYVSKTLDSFFDGAEGAIRWKKAVPVYKLGPDGKTLQYADGKPIQVVDKNGRGELEWQEDQSLKREAIEAQAKAERRVLDFLELYPDAPMSEVRKKIIEARTDSTRPYILQMMEGAMKPAAAVGSDDLRGYVEASGLPNKLPAPLKPYAQDFLDAAAEYNLNPKALAAISMLETDRGTSKAFREKNNAMGISDDSGPTAQASVRDSIFRMARVLASGKGPYAKARTLDEFGRIYAPPGAKNDFKNTNSGWAAGVREHLRTL